MEKSDRAIIDSLLAGEPTDYNLAEPARLRIRYRGFLGARDIQADLAKITQNGVLQKQLCLRRRAKFMQILATKVAVAKARTKTGIS